MTLDIMMPYYGSFDHFRSAVNSVINQSDPDWRLVIIDDVYPDPAPGAWARKITDTRVTYLRNEANLRPSRNYNKAIGLASSEFVVIMGCDDVLLAGYVARIHELIEQFPQATVIQPGVTVIDENGRSFLPLTDRVKNLYRLSGRGARTASGERLAISLLNGNWTYFPSLAWRTSSLKPVGFRTDLDVVQDLAKLLELTWAGATLVVDDQKVFAYRRHSRSLSAETGVDGTKFVQENTLFSEAAADARSRGWRRAARSAQLHLSSRLNAATELPTALRSHESSRRRLLVHHIFGGRSPTKGL